MKKLNCLKYIYIIGRELCCKTSSTQLIPENTYPNSVHLTFIYLYINGNKIPNFTKTWCFFVMCFSGRYPHAQIALHLIKEGQAAVDAVTKTGGTALHGAALQGNKGSNRAGSIVTISIIVFCCMNINIII